MNSKSLSRIRGLATLLQILALLGAQGTLTSCQTTGASKQDEITTAPKPVAPISTVESPAASCNELLGTICPKDLFEPHTCETFDERTEKPDGKLKLLDVSECLTRKSMAAEICKTGAVPSAAHIRCKPVHMDKRTIDCAAILTTMCSANFAPAKCVGALERQKLPIVHLTVDGSNHCTADLDLQKKICTLMSVEKKPKQKTSTVLNWKIGCAKLESSL